jgi:hypothetical protein
MAKAAERLLSAHATTAATERNWSAWGHMFSPDRSSLSLKTAEKIIYIKSNSNTAATSYEQVLKLNTVAGVKRKALSDQDQQPMDV